MSNLQSNSLQTRKITIPLLHKRMVSNFQDYAQITTITLPVLSSAYTRTVRGQLTSQTPHKKPITWCYFGFKTIAAELTCDSQAPPTFSSFSTSGKQIFILKGEKDNPNDSGKMKKKNVERRATYWQYSRFSLALQTRNGMIQLFFWTSPFFNRSSFSLVSSDIYLFANKFGPILKKNWFLRELVCKAVFRQPRLISVRDFYFKSGADLREEGRDPQSPLPRWHAAFWNKQNSSINSEN